ncbi:YybH family protein [Methylobacterium planeticum]|uniref:DUF4440 domain-containing protein n=1 Tax=Methylobacterium planeticum TaxID=2615211 RepID=A0A6N6MF82_9HYPH|nr:DUF4440 domain-containing protein [Methylobacterium planeticum]KAB1069476.1 DUF4440 domain-containing protein [Methylobacterium planeticum]
MNLQGQAVADLWDQTFNRGDTDELGKLYSADGQVIPAGGSPVRGTESIAAFFADLRAKGFKDHKITVQDTSTRAETLILTGLWHLTGPAESGQAQSYGGNWVNVLERRGDRWLTLLHTWN